jgi:twitching motility protein PilT
MHGGEQQSDSIHVYIVIGAAVELLDLPFSDLFVGADPASSWLKATPDAREMEFVPEALFSEIDGLRRDLLARSTTQSFSIEWGTSRRERLRVKPLTTAHIEPLFVCRRFTGTPKPMIELGIPAAVVDRLLSRPVRNGLILFIGSMAAGKTTAASSFTVEYISRHGGVAMTVEAPIEMDLEGRHGKGIVYQTEVESDDDMGPALRGMLRSAANLLFCGEVKTDVAAREVLNLSTSGHPVVTTFHGPDLPTGLLRFARSTGDQNDALAHALTAVFHLTLRNPRLMPGVPLPPGLPGQSSPPDRLLTVSPLLVVDGTRDQVRSAIRSGNFDQLGSEIERQRRLFLGGGSP